MVPASRNVFVGTSSKFQQYPRQRLILMSSSSFFQSEKTITTTMTKVPGTDVILYPNELVLLSVSYSMSIYKFDCNFSFQSTPLVSLPPPPPKRISKVDRSVCRVPYEPPPTTTTLRMDGMSWNDHYNLHQNQYHSPIPSYLLWNIPPHRRSYHPISPIPLYIHNNVI